jgi:hypothetical protein
LKLRRKHASAIPDHVTWEYVRDVKLTKPIAWLAVFQRDEPNTTFVISAKKPSKRGKDHVAQAANTKPVSLAR